MRQHLFPEVQPRFSGLIAWRGTLDATQLPKDYTARRVQLWMGPNAHLVAYPIAGGRQINVVAVLPGTWNRPGWSTPGDPLEVMDAFAAPRWPPTARMMLATVDSWRKWALFGVPDDCPWSKGPVALLGDAVHAMLPFAAQGAGMAIEDAAVLAQHLSLEAAESTAGITAALKTIWPGAPGARAAGATDRAATGPHLSSQRAARVRARSCDPRARPGPHAGAAGLDLRLAAVTRALVDGALPVDFGARLDVRPAAARSRRQRPARLGRRFPAPVAAPGVLGQLRLPAYRDVVVAIGKLGHDGAARPGLGLVHQPLQIRGAVGERLALAFELLAVVQFVPGGIGEGRSDRLAHASAAGQREAGREQRGNRAQARRRERNEAGMPDE